MIRPLTHVTAAVALVGAALLVTACAPSAQEADPEKPATSAPIETAAPHPAATPTGQPAAVGDDPTCETIISPTTVADFESLGWTTLSDEFRVASVDLPGGVQCIWGDFSTASDHVQIFGWAPITAEQTDTAVSELLADGWRREDGPDGVYITEKSETAVATDAEGYGLTYLFGDGWVTYADTKQGLVLVEWPPS